MGGLAIAMFVALFVFGNQFLGWHDPDGHVQLGLFASFLFGVIIGFRIRA